MSRRSKWIAIAMVATSLALLWGTPFGAKQALREYLWPTTVQWMPLPADCTSSNETPSPGVLRIVELQRSYYGLSLQKIMVCRIPRRLPRMEPDFTDQLFRPEVRRKWLPLYVGCCSYRKGRHTAVVIAQIDERGSLIVQAALIQSRRDFLRLNWTKINPAGAVASNLALDARS